MGSTKVSAPKPSKEENALRVEQTNLLRMQQQILTSQQQQNSALMPIFAEQMGLSLQYDGSGNVVGASQTAEAAKMEGLQTQLMEKTLNQLLHPESDPMYGKQMSLLDMQLTQLQEELTGPQAIQNKEIQKLLGERTLKALKGELEIDPALERDLKGQEQTLKERLQQQLGPGFETSSAGIEAMQKYREGADVLRYQARRGELTLSEQLSMARTGADIAQGGLALGGASAKLPGADPLSSGGFAFGVGQGTAQNQATLRQVLASPLGIAGGYGQVASGFQMPIGQLMNDRQMKMDASLANAQNNASGLGALGGVFGAILGMSDRRLKSNVEVIGEWNGIPICAYDIFGVRKIGVMAQDLLAIRPDLVSEFGGWLRVDYGGLNG